MNILETIAYKPKANYTERPYWQVINGLAYLGIALALLAAGGCNFNAPKVRVGYLPTSTIGISFPDPNNLGKHSYQFNPFEKGGIVYTCKAGHIDIDHIRGSADAAKYLISRSRETLMRRKEGFSFTFTMERSAHEIKFSYPENWDSLAQNEKERIADDISFAVGHYMAFNATAWHEILTWFGVRFAGFEPEFNSAFSWEDVYSNLLGAKLAVEAIKDPNHSYNEAMTLAINRELKKLGVQSAKTAKYASEKMRGKWFTGNIFVDTLRRNTDIGLDGFVTPVIVPGICEDKPLSYPVPNLDVLSKYGFSIQYTILPKEFEKGKILRIIYPDGNGKTIEPARDFRKIMEFIEKQAVEKYGYDIGSQ